MRKSSRILHIILTCIISFLVFYYVTSEFLDFHFQGLYAIQAPLYLLILFGQTLIFYGSSYLLLNPSHRIPTFVLRLLWVIYFLVMILLLFFRVYHDNNINLNILELFNFETTNLSQTILNLILFIPIGYWFKHLKISSVLLLSLLLITSIELFQFVSHRGIFDVVDILINTIGIMRNFRKLFYLLVSSTLLLGCKPTPESQTFNTKEMFNLEYVDQKESDIKEYSLLTDDTPAFKEITFESSIKFFTEGYSGILYYGKVGCPWCERAVPILNAVAKDNNISIYYIDANKGMGETKREREENYANLSKYISDSFQEDDNGKKGMFVPDVIAVKNGKMVSYHVSLVDDYDIHKDEQLSENQKQELYNIYQQMINQIK